VMTTGGGCMHSILIYGRQGINFVETPAFDVNSFGQSSLPIGISRGVTKLQGHQLRRFQVCTAQRQEKQQ